MNNIKKIFRKYSINFVSDGKNVAHNNINIKCPFCTNDPSYHLGISLKTGQYGCWRNSRHCGTLVHLLTVILNCTFSEANQILHIDSVILDDWSVTLKEIRNIPKMRCTSESAKYLILPQEFKQICNSGVYSRFWDYLKYRGFVDIEKLCEEYNLRCCLSGDWKYRLIFPIELYGNIVTWQSRAILSTDLKYKDLNVDESIRGLKDCVFNFDSILRTGGNILYITEGVFDALKLDFFNTKKNRATCLFTKVVSQSQTNLIAKLGKRFNRIVVLLDNDALSNALTIKNELSIFHHHSITIGKLVDNVKDPGDLTITQIQTYY